MFFKIRSLFFVWNMFNIVFHVTRIKIQMCFTNPLSQFHSIFSWVLFLFYVFFFIRNFCFCSFHLVWRHGKRLSVFTNTIGGFRSLLHGLSWLDKVRVGEEMQHLTSDESVHICWASVTERFKSVERKLFVVSGCSLQQKFVSYCWTLIIVVCT